MSAPQSCTHCGGRDFECVSGTYICMMCSTQSQSTFAVADHEMAYDEVGGDKFMKMRQTLRIARGTGKKEGKQIKAGGKEVFLESPIAYWEVYTHALSAQANALVRLGGSAELSDTVLKLWINYMRHLGVAFCPNKQGVIGPLENYHSNLSKDSNMMQYYQTVSRDVRDRQARINAQRAVRDAQLRKALLAQEETTVGQLPGLVEEAEGGAEETAQTSEPQKAADDFAEVIEKSEDWTSEDGTPLYVSVSYYLAFLHLACLVRRQNATLSDLMRWRNQGVIPSKALRLAPEHCNHLVMVPSLCRIFTTTDQIATLSVQQLRTVRLAHFLGVDSLPGLSVESITYRLLIDLNLPLALMRPVKHLTSVKQPSNRIRGLKPSGYIFGVNASEVMPIPVEVKALGYILTSLRLCFGLDDDAEIRLSDVAKRKEGSFVFTQWLQQFRMRVAVALHEQDPNDVINRRWICERFTSLGRYKDGLKRRHRLHCNTPFSFNSDIAQVLYPSQEFEAKRTEASQAELFPLRATCEVLKRRQAAGASFDEDLFQLYIRDFTKDHIDFLAGEDASQVIGGMQGDSVIRQLDLSSEPTARRIRIARHRSVDFVRDLWREYGLLGAFERRYGRAMNTVGPAIEAEFATDIISDSEGSAAAADIEEPISFNVDDVIARNRMFTQAAEVRRLGADTDMSSDAESQQMEVVPEVIDVEDDDNDASVPTTCIGGTLMACAHRYVQYPTITTAYLSSHTLSNFEGIKDQFSLSFDYLVTSFADRIIEKPALLYGCLCIMEWHVLKIRNKDTKDVRYLGWLL